MKAPLSLKSYRDAAAGVAFEYPPNWKQVRKTSGFSPPFAFSESNPATVIVEFMSAGTAYENTNIESLDFVYGWSKANSTSACRKRTNFEYFDDTRTMRRVIHGVAFDRAAGGEGSAGHLIHSQIYAAYRDGTCYIFEEDFTRTAPDVGSERTLTHEEQLALQRSLDRIMQSVVFTSSQPPKPTP